MKIEPIDINVLETEFDQFAGYVPLPTKGNLATIVDKINEIVKHINEQTPQVNIGGTVTQNLEDF